MPEMFGQLAERVDDWRAIGVTEPAEFELTSDRELSGSDEDGHVFVTMKDFEVSSIQFDGHWFNSGVHRDDVAAATVKAINSVLKQYLTEEILAAQNAAVGMDEVYDQIRELQADFSVAFENAMSKIRDAK